mgnify:FL=1
MTSKKTAREPRVEALRLVAAASIAVFHTFMPWFYELTHCYGLGAYIVDNPVATPLLGFFNLLGAFGNNVFFFISGLFLVPAAARASLQDGYWAAQRAKTAARVKQILATVALYLALILGVSAFVFPIDGVSLGELPSLLVWLEFIWVYLALTALAPVIGWVWARIRRPKAAAAVIIAAVFAVNAYIAFFDMGELDRGLLDWRKLMSAVTYFAAFIGGAALADVRLRPGAAATLLAAAVGVSLGVECKLAWSRELLLMYATSFKSTSALSFAMAAAAVLFARRSGGKKGAGLGLATRFSPSILGFYILQSLTSPLWQPAFGELLEDVYLMPQTTSCEMLAAGVGLSFALLAALLAFDRVFRLRLFAAISRHKEARAA